MKKFLNTLLVVFLIIVIVGGVGYIGYSYLFMDHAGMNIASTQDTQATSGNSDTMPGMNMGTSQDTQASSSSGTMPGMQQRNGTGQQIQGNDQNMTGNPAAVSQTSTILKNREELNDAIAGLDETIKYLTLDPYGSEPDIKAGSDSVSMPDDTNTESDNTTINIYPQDNNTLNIVPPNGSNTAVQQNNGGMQNMGTAYDATKMEQLHSGIYNLSVGKAMIEQLKKNLENQVGYANSNGQDLVQFYSNQYYLTQQNKNKLDSALSYINRAAELVNINPYVSVQGPVYDQERMGQIHKSVFQLAESVVALNLLNDEMTDQSINLSNKMQDAYNNANIQMNNSAMSMGSSSSVFGNINLQTVINIILILFVASLIFGIFGFVMSLFKSKPERS